MLKHPAVILHELAHGYHDQILGFEHPAIIAAYEQAREAGSYANVLLYSGERVSHYALTDHKEYFAGEAALKAGGVHNTMGQFA